MSRFEQIEISLVADSALDVELTARALRNGGLARRQSCESGLSSFVVRPADSSTPAGPARRAGYCRLAINRRPTP